MERPRLNRHAILVSAVIRRVLEALWLIDAGYDLVGMVAGEIMLAVWKPKPVSALVR
jgi:hypothetical protein